MVSDYIEYNLKTRTFVHKDNNEYYSISNSKNKNKQGKIYKKYLKSLHKKKHSSKLSSKKHLTKRKNIQHKNKLKGGNIFANPVPDRMGVSPEEMRKREEARKKAAAEKIAAIKAAVLKSTKPQVPNTPTPNKINATHLVSQVLHHTSGLGSPIQHIQQIQSILPTQSTPINTPLPVRTPIRTFKPGKV